MDHDDALRVLKAITTAFDEHDLEGIMVHFGDDAVFEGPRGIRVDLVRDDDRGASDRRPRLRPLDPSRWQGREEGFVLEDPHQRMTAAG